jgi:hypothetical protein
MRSMDDKLDGLFAEYRQALPDCEAGPDFTPRLWQKIESRRIRTVFLFRRVAQVCVMTTVALALLMGMATNIQNEPPGVSGNYVDELVADQSNNPAALLAGEDLL